MKTILLFLALVPIFSNGQNKTESEKPLMSVNSYVRSIDNLTLEAAFELTKRATDYAASLNKKVTIAILDASGTTIYWSVVMELVRTTLKLPEERHTPHYQQKRQHSHYYEMQK